MRSTFLRGLCSEAPQHAGSSDVIHLIVPISGDTLFTIHELLYTGQVNKTRREIEEVSAGLALLGINDFSGMPVKPRAFLHAGITAIPVSRKQNNNNNNNAAVEVVEMQQFLKDGPPGPKTIVNNPITPLSSQAAGLLVQKLDPTQISVTIKREANNNAETKTPDQERTRRKRIQTNPGLDFTRVGSGYFFRRSILLWAKIHTSASEVLVKYTS